jgi:hypothetical protein
LHYFSKSCNKSFLKDLQHGAYSSPLSSADIQTTSEIRPVPRRYSFLGKQSTTQQRRLGRLPAVVQDVGVIPASVFQGFGQGGQVVMATFIVGGLARGHAPKSIMC